MRHSRFVVQLCRGFLFTTFVLLLARSSIAAEGWKTPTVEEVEAFANNLLQAVDSGEPDKINELIDWSAILDRATAKISAPKSKESFRALFMANINNEGQLARDLVKIHKQGGSYTALNRRVENGFGRTMFRLILPNGEFNYHDYAVAKQADGKVRAVDIYVFLTGETMSQTLRRSFLPSAAGEDVSLKNGLTASDRAFLKNVSQVNDFNSAVDAGDSKAALTVFQKFPEDLKREKNVLILRLLAAQRVSLEELALAINDFAKYHPNDACMNMLSIDAFAMQKDYDKAIGAVSKLSQLVGNDPYLNLVKSNIYQRAGDRPNAEKFVKKAIEADEYLLEAHWSLLGFALQDKDHAATLDLLQQIDQKFHMQFNDLSKVPQYKSFAESDEYQKWLGYLALKSVRSKEKQAE